MKNKMLQAWKNADKPANFDAPVANVSVNESTMLHDIVGGSSAGWVCGISGESNGSGASCGTTKGQIDQILSWLS